METSTSAGDGFLAESPVALNPPPQRHTIVRPLWLPISVDTMLRQLCSELQTLELSKLIEESLRTLVADTLRPPATWLALGAQTHQSDMKMRLVSIDEAVDLCARIFCRTHGLKRDQVLKAAIVALLQRNGLSEEVIFRYN